MNRRRYHRKEVRHLWTWRVLTALFTLHCSLLASVAQNASLASRYSSERPVVVTCDWDKPPYEFLNDNGQPAGSNIDIIKVIMKELDLPVRFVMKEWGNALKTFERGDADLILANGQRYASPPYVVSNNIVNYNRIMVAVRARDSIATVTQQMLEEGQAVFKPSDFAAKYFIEGDPTRATKVEFQSPKVALTGIAAGDNEYFVWGEQALKWKIKELNLEGITLCNVDIPISEIHLVSRDRELIEEIDDHYSRLKQSGEVERIHNRWFHPERVRSATPSSAVYAVIGFLLLIALFYLFYRLSRKRVEKDTGDVADLNKMMYKAMQMGNFVITEYDIKDDLMTNRYGRLLPDGGLKLEQFIDHIHPDEQADFRHKMERLVSGRDRKSDLEKHWHNDDGKWLTLHGHAMVELDEEGHPAYIINAVHNETHDVEEARDYQNLKRKYDCLFNMPIIGMSIYDKDGWPIVINDAMKQLCGYDRIENERYWNSLCMFDIPLFRSAYSPDERDDLIVCQHMEYPEMGIDRYIEFHVHPVTYDNGEVTNYVCSAIDITDEHERVHQIYDQERRIRLTNEQINNYEKQLRYVLANGKMYVWRSDMASKKLEFTRSLRKPEFVETYEDFLNHMDPEQRQQVIKTWTTPSSPGQMFNMTYHFYHHNNDNYPQWCHSVGFPVTDDEGRVTGHFGIIRDITDLMEAQQRLREETARAEDSSHQKSMFLASMTHELRTPLNSIVGFSDLLSSVESPEEKREFIRIIRTNCDMLLRLINDILEASSINDGPQSINPSDVDFATAFDDICQTLEQRVQNPGVTFIKDAPYSTCLTRLDIGRIQQVITNFVINAVKYTRQGHIRVGYIATPLDTRLPAPDAKFTALMSNFYKEGLFIYCEDTGAGIPKDKQQSVFERFVKLNEFVQGTGLGLSICKSIAERCGGHIGVSSEGEGYGSTFWIWVPCNLGLMTPLTP